MSDRTRRKFAVVIIVGALAVAWLGIVSKPGSPAAPRDLTIDAKIICQDFVKDRLRAPASAAFAAYASQTAIPVGAGQFRVNGYVDAQNAFGANIRTTYDCTIRNATSGDWSLVSLDTSP